MLFYILLILIIHRIAHRQYNFPSLKIMYVNGTSDCNLKVVCFHDMAKEHATKYTIRILSPEKSFRWQ